MSGYIFKTTKEINEIFFNNAIIIYYALYKEYVREYFAILFAVTFNMLGELQW